MSERAPRALHLLDADAVRGWAIAATHALAAAAAEIDALNVYPVPDGDTGTNLHLTLQAGERALTDQVPSDLAGTLDCLARGALMGARGNSGVIVSQLLRGIAEILGPAVRADGPALAAALSRAAELGYAAVAEPVEGTILTVARAAAAGAGSASAGDNGTGPASDPGLIEVVDAARRAAAQALSETPGQLPILARAGVVDAGGRGLCVLLDALHTVVSGGSGADDSTVPPVSERPLPRRDSPAVRETGSVEFGYEVQFLLTDSSDAAVVELRTVLAPLGDSLVIVGSGSGVSPGGEAEVWNVHVHVNDVGAAIEAGVEAGRPYRISVTRFADQIAAAGAAALESRWHGRGIVAVAPGPGLAGVFAAEGVYVVDGGPTSNPSTAEVLAAITATGAAEVIVLPNHANVTAVADAAAAQARDDGQDVAVVPTRSPVQGLAAVAVADPQRRFPDDVIALAEAAAATRWGEITVAVRESMTMVGRCAAGDVLGLAEGDVVLIGADQTVVACELIDRMLLAGGELVTLVLGADADDDLRDGVVKHLGRTHPEIDVADYRGDQPHQPVLIGVE